MKQFDVLMKLTRTTLVWAAVLCIAADMALADYETAEYLQAAEVLSPQLISGERFKVDERVQNDGYLNYYTIHSDFGDFEAESTAMLRVREREIDALASLEELSGTEVFISAMADAGMDEIRVIGAFASRPVATLKGLPQGVERMFSQYSRRADDAVADTRKYLASQKDLKLSDREYEDYKQSAVELTERYFKISDAERDWARRLGTDPYTSNDTLRKAIKDVAWVDRLGRIAHRYSGLSIPYVGWVAKVNDAVWGKDPYELRDFNRARLAATGADEELIDAFLENPWISPTRQTELTESISILESATGLAGILRQSLNVVTEVEALYFVRSVSLLAWYHQNQSGFASVNTELAIPGGVKPDGTAVLLFPSDYVYWTQTMAQTALEYRALSEGHPGQKPEMWILGQVSERARGELLELGFELHTGFAAQVKADIQSAAHSNIPRVEGVQGLFDRVFLSGWPLAENRH
jgi:hypothetical protein